MEVDFQNGEVIDDRRSDRHDNEKCRGSQQQDCAEIVEECADTHDERLKYTSSLIQCIVISVWRSLVAFDICKHSTNGRLGSYQLQSRFTKTKWKTRGIG